jgi:hypothetical protein
MNTNIKNLTRGNGANGGDTPVEIGVHSCPFAVDHVCPQLFAFLCRLCALCVSALKFPVPLSPAIILAFPAAVSKVGRQPMDQQHFFLSSGRLLYQITKLNLNEL